jgi:hypothetical protein
VLRDEAAGRHDAEAIARDEAAAARDQDATVRLTAALRRLDQADSQDAQRFATALAAAGAARTLYAGVGDSHAALIEAEAACEAETVHLVGNGIERRAVREDMDHAAQHLAASSSNRRAAAANRAAAQADRKAADNDRLLAKANRQQSALDRAADPDLALYLDRPDRANRPGAR